MQVRCSFVIPCFNEASRLRMLEPEYKAFVESKSAETEIIFVNDGSNDETSTVLNEWKRNWKGATIRTREYMDNQGKGFALQQGVPETNGDYVIILDADLSTSFSMFYILENQGLKPETCYFGDRVLGHKQGMVDAKPHRRILGDVFKWIVSAITGLPVIDTQCGFKVFPGELARNVFGKIKENGFAYDVELYLLLKKMNVPVIQVPVNWVHREGSHLGLLSDGWKMIRRIRKIAASYNNEKTPA